MTRRIAPAILLIGVIAATAAAATRYVAYAEARPVLDALAEVLPPELKTSSEGQERVWPEWATRHDRDIRARVEAGDQETIVNWLLFGTSFTTQPRALFEDLSDQPGRPRRMTDAQFATLVGDRANDLVTALARPGQDERRLFARDLLVKLGYSLATPDQRVRLIQHLLMQVTQVMDARARYARELDSIRQHGDASDQFAERSRLFRDRGLSADTSFRPNYGLERALASMKDQGLLAAGSVHDIAVIGPGLDFADKSSGYDFYPQQTLQPFALIDSLIRLGLAADAAAVDVTTLDLSPRVNAHLQAMRRWAMAGQPYRIRLPLDPQTPWSPDMLAYWNTAGDRIGTASAPVETNVNGEKVRVRTLAIRPSVALHVAPEDVNVVVQRLDGRQFDLVVATNIFIYYDAFEQALAMANVGAMLRPRGFLLTNNALPELPGKSMRSAGYVTVAYSILPEDGDHFVWYRAE